MAKLFKASKRNTVPGKIIGGFIGFYFGFLFSFMRVLAFILIPAGVIIGSKMGVKVVAFSKKNYQIFIIIGLGSI